MFVCRLQHHCYSMTCCLQHYCYSMTHKLDWERYKVEKGCRKIAYCKNDADTKPEWTRPWNFCCDKSRCNAKQGSLYPYVAASPVFRWNERFNARHELSMSCVAIKDRSK